MMLSVVEHPKGVLVFRNGIRAGDHGQMARFAYIGTKA
jgi:hypothetical protein